MDAESLGDGRYGLGLGEPLVLDRCDTPTMDAHDPADPRVAGVETTLRDEGWAQHASVSRELANWRRLGDEARAYSMTVDDYTNDLCSRDYLELAISRLPADVSESLFALVADADETFRESTIDDGDGILGRFFRIDAASNWWWRRIPRSGPLAAYLAAARGE